MAAAAEAAERGGRSGALRTGSYLTTGQRRAVLEVEERHGTPPGTIVLGGQCVRINITEPGQEEPETETEAEAQAEGPTEVQQEEQPLWRSTCARTQAASRTGTQG